MKTTNILIIFVLLTIFSCIQNVEKPIELPVFDLKGQSILHFINTTDDTVNIRYRNSTVWPPKDNRKPNVIAPQSERTEVLTAQGRNEFFLSVGDSVFNLFSIPDSKDTITIAKSSNQLEVKFSGQLKDINEFQEKKKQHFQSIMSDGIGRQELMTDGSSSMDRLFEYNDSITNVNLSFLLENKSHIPSWYEEFEIKRLNYLNTWWKMNCLLWYTTQIKVDSIPLTMFDEVFASIPIEDSTMIGNSDYMMFLGYFIEYRNKVAYKVNSNNLSKLEGKEKRLAIINKELSGTYKDALLARTISIIVERFDVPFDSAWVSNIDDVGFRDLLMNAYREYAFSLVKGDDMPYFYLPDSSDHYYEPSKFANQIVLINFWNPGCKPCIKEFPDENELVDRYADQPVSIVNICTATPSEEVWKKIIAKHELKTVNLLATGEWSKKIKEGFDIRSQPHSVLVDWNGKIVENKCARASGNIDKQIDELLLQMAKERVIHL